MFPSAVTLPPPHDDRVWDLIEEAGDIGVKHVPAAGSVDFPHTLECHVAGASRPEAVRIVVKQPLEQWTAQSKRLFLCHALTHVRDIRRPCATETFGDHHTPNGSWRVGSLLEVPHQRGRVLLKMSRGLLDADPIDSGFAFIASDDVKSVEEDDFTPPRRCTLWTESYR